MKFDPSLHFTACTFQRTQSVPTKNYPQNIWLVILFFFVVMFFGQILGMIVITILGFSSDATLPMLYSTAFSTICSVLYCCKIEKRSLRAMGFTKQNAVFQYLIGMVLGTAMLGGAVMLAKAFGAMTYQGIAEPIAWGSLAVYFFGWVLQGMSEEVLCRSQLLCGLGVYRSPWVSILISGGVFTALHLANPNTSILGFVNLFLFGVFSALLFLRTDNIWMVSALHSLWNCAQGNLFGIEVSGMTIDTTIFRFSAVEGMNFISGGAFGIEGGLAATSVLLLGSAVLLFEFRNPSKLSPEVSQPLPLPKEA